MRYELRSLETGWAVWDTVENTPAVGCGVWYVGLEGARAERLARNLNYLDRIAPKEKPAG